MPTVLAENVDCLFTLAERQNTSCNSRCQDFEFPTLLVLLYVHLASLFYID
jgi:hypothetical protein